MKENQKSNALSFTNIQRVGFSYSLFYTRDTKNTNFKLNDTYTNKIL